MDLLELRDDVYNNLAEQIVNRWFELNLERDEWTDRMKELGILREGLQFGDDISDITLNSIVGIAEAAQCTVEIKLIPKSDDYEYYADIEKMMDE